MRIAIDPHDDVGSRAGHILLAEPELERLGLLDRDPADPDERQGRVDDLSAYDVLVTDAPDPAVPLRRAAKAGISAVVWVDAVDHAVAVAPGRSVLTGANLASGIAPSLATHEALVAGPEAEVSIAWTEPGHPLRRGHPVRFPDPVGPLWAKERRRSGRFRRFAAPLDGPWAGASVHISNDRPPYERVVGVGDDARHLEALALAAGAVVAAGGGLPDGLVTVDAIAERYLDAALQLGLEVAEWSAASPAEGRR